MANKRIFDAKGRVVWEANNNKSPMRYFDAIHCMSGANIPIDETVYSSLNEIYVLPFLQSCAAKDHKEPCVAGLDLIDCEPSHQVSHNNGRADGYCPFKYCPNCGKQIQ